MISEKSIYHEVHVSSQLWCKDAPKVSARRQKSFISEFPILSILRLHLWELVVFIGIDLHILIEISNFKTLLKENYAVALNSRYLFTKKMFEHDIDSAYGVCIN